MVCSIGRARVGQDDNVKRDTENVEQRVALIRDGFPTSCAHMKDAQLYRSAFERRSIADTRRVSSTTGFIFEVRVPSSSTKKIINIGELCPTVDSPLERTSEGNPRVQHVDQVQNQTKNPFTYLMSTVASFQTPDDLLYCLFFN